MPPNLAEVGVVTYMDTYKEGQDPKKDVKRVTTIILHLLSTHKESSLCSAAGQSDIIALAKMRNDQIKQKMKGILFCLFVYSDLSIRYAVFIYRTFH